MLLLILYASMLLQAMKNKVTIGFQSGNMLKLYSHFF